MVSPSEVLRKFKKTDKDDNAGKDADNDKDDKKGGKRSALIDFIAKHKK